MKSIESIGESEITFCVADIGSAGLIGSSSGELRVSRGIMSAGVVIMCSFVFMNLDLVFSWWSFRLMKSGNRIGVSESAGICSMYWRRVQESV